MKKFNHVISLLFDIVLTSFEIVNNIDDMFICVKTNIGGCSERYSERRPHRIYSEKQGMSVVSLSAVTHEAKYSNQTSSAARHRADTIGSRCTVTIRKSCFQLVQSEELSNTNNLWL